MIVPEIYPKKTSAQRKMYVNREIHFESKFVDARLNFVQFYRKLWYRKKPFVNQISDVIFSLPKTKQIHCCFINRTILVQRNRKKYKLEQDATNSTTGIHRLSHLNWFKLAWYKIPVQFYVRASMQFSQQIFLSLYRLINHENERIKQI